MIPLLVAGLVVPFVIALAVVNRGSLAQGIAPSITAINNARSQRIMAAPAPQRYIDWFLRTRIRPIVRRWTAKTADASTGVARADALVKEREGAFPEGVPTGMVTVRITIVGVLLVISALGSVVLDWTLLYTFANNNALLATLAVGSIVAIPVGLSLVGQRVLSHRPNAQRVVGGWSQEQYGTAWVVLGFAYVVLLIFVGVLGATRGAYAYESALHQEAVNYTATVNSTNAKWDPQISEATLRLTEAEGDSRTNAAVVTSWEQTLAGLERDRDNELKSNEDEHATLLENLNNNQSATTTKWIALALISSVVECACAYGGGSALALARLVDSRARARAATDRLTKANGRANRAVNRQLDRLGRELERAGFGPESFDQAVAGVFVRPGAPVPPPVLGGPARDIPAPDPDPTDVNSTPEGEAGEVPVPDEDPPVDAPSPGFGAV